MGQYPPYPMQPPGYPQPPQPGPHLSPYRTVGKTEQSSRPHPNTKASPRPRGYQPQVPPSSSLPPSGNQRPPSNLNSASRTGNLSFDSTTTHEIDAGQPLPPRRSKDVPPPPPPPLPPHYAHVRRDSTGSVSSLGSMVNTEGEDDRRDKKKPDPRQGETEGSEGFFQRLNPWSPKPPTVMDFHQKNQAFLKRHDRQNSNTPPMSPRTQQLRYVLSVPCCVLMLRATIYFADLIFASSLLLFCRLSGMDRPPASRVSHKRLPSIEHDNWEEDETSPSPRPGSRHHGTHRSGRHDMENFEESSSVISSR
jgi:hypothetical protein